MSSRSIFASTASTPDPAPLLYYPLAFCAGAAAVLGFAPFDYGWLIGLSPALLFILLRRATPGESFRLGWCYGFGLMAFGVFWMRISINQFGGINAPLAIALTLLFAAVMALFFGFGTWLAAWVSRGWARTLLALPGAWVLLEWLRGWVLSGFPWLSLGYSQIDSPLVGLAPVAGVYGVSLAVLIIAGLMTHFVRIWPLVLIPIIAASGYALSRQDWVEPAGEHFTVSLLQGNVEQQIKWRAEQFAPTLRRYLNLTSQVTGSALVIWPETAVPTFAHRVETQLLAPLHTAAIRARQDVLIGIPVKEDDGSYYNAMLNLGISGRQHYYKRHLVPFGEFMPLNSVLRPLIDLFDIPMSEFSAGDGGPPLIDLVGMPAGISICYEDAFNDEVRAALPAARLLVNVSNDAWFGDSLAPHQHLEIARMRAAENGRYLLRATNTGISAIIDARGRITGIAPQFREYVLTGLAQPMTGITPFARYGNKPALAVAFGFLLLAGLLRGTR